jgi:dephospho-CoA kinase
MNRRSKFNKGQGSSELSLSRTSSKTDDSIDARKALNDSKHPITRICLTGGPCAGKTTALVTLS